MTGAVRYDTETGLPSFVRLVVEDMRGRRAQNAGDVLELQFRDVDGFTVVLILTSLADVQQLRGLLT